MKKIKLSINHKDKRGLITDLLEKKMINAVTLITQKKGTVRGNHYHKKTIQWNYLLSGKIEVVGKKNGKNKKKIILKQGDLVVTDKKEAHAIKALIDSRFLVFTQGPRGGKDYENDTYRLKIPLIR
jgi:dTDP-4-dehydrorhamnose 3,5-epimerase-like enzyme